MVRWLGPHASIVWDRGLIPDQRTNIPQAAQPNKQMFANLKKKKKTLPESNTDHHSRAIALVWAFRSGLVLLPQHLQGFPALPLSSFNLSSPSSQSHLLLWNPAPASQLIPRGGDVPCSPPILLCWAPPMDPVFTLLLCVKQARPRSSPGPLPCHPFPLHHSSSTAQNGCLPHLLQAFIQKSSPRDFPGGPVVKNPPSKAVDTGSISRQRTKVPHASEWLSPGRRY